MSVQSNEDGITIPVIQEQVPVQESRAEEKYFSEDEVQKIRQQEKGKMYKRLEDVRKFNGAIPGPIEAWLALRGIRTFVMRFEKAQINGRAVERTQF